MKTSTTFHKCLYARRCASKNLKNLLLTAIVLGMATTFSIAQNQAYWIHTDQVKPSKQAEYEQVSKDFVEACKKHDLKGADWSVAHSNDGNYVSIAPIENMAAFDKNPLAPLMEKMGEDKFRALFARFNECYDKHGDAVIVLNSDLSYMPNGLTTNTVGQDYRKWHYLYVTPINSAKLNAKIKDIKALYEKKGAKEHFRVYHSGFGNMDEYFLVSISAKDAQSYEKTSDETETLLGEEGKKLMNEMFVLLDRYESKTGRMRPDLGYVAKL